MVELEDLSSGLADINPVKEMIDLNKLKILYDEGLDDYRIAKRLNCSRQGVAYNRNKLNLSPNPKGKYRKSIVRKITTQNLIYLAGFIDGEGTISVTGEKEFHPIIQIDNTNKEIINWVLELIGTGKVKERKRNNLKWKLCYRYKLQTQPDIMNFLSQIIPYLRIKRKQAELLKQFCDIRLSKPDGIKLDSIIERKIVKEIMILNKRGI